MKPSPFLFLRTILVLGSFSFGGYMMLVELLRKKLVDDYRWLSSEEFSEGLSLATILPGPVAVNTMVFCSYRLFGPVVALLSVGVVLLPSFLLIILLTTLYQQITDWNGLGVLLSTINGTVVGILVAAGVVLIKKACRSPWHYVIVMVSFGVLILNSGYFSMLLLLCFWAAAAQRWSQREVSNEGYYEPYPFTWPSKRNLLALVSLVVLMVMVGSQYFFLLDLFKVFAGISLTLFGGGYVVFPLLKATLVEGRHWLTDSDILLGISMGQLSPGPILIGSAFYGQKLAGLSGAIAATAGMFLPPAFLMLTVAGFSRGLKNFLFYHKALDFIQPYVSSLVLFAGFGLSLSWYKSATSFEMLIPLLAFGLSYYFKIQPIWLMLSALLIGLLLTLCA